ncbi:hypothetical protein [Methylobacterium sp. ARG-1]|uniref:hypothetical protein n=1 Tax=Methylobacterium sp. ARG-1 TaxID=1692501 RepID=UPI000683366A|nr:hypothetical protein [Methylobacterium sp. ARG-1]KNY22654.1 hypothetical protein AKJ13_10345 [Methylobacterium sp. ARG-1]
MLTDDELDGLARAGAAHGDEDALGPDGKIDVMGKRLKMTRVGVPEYARHVARRIETTEEFAMKMVHATPMVRALAGLTEQGPNRAARRAAAAQARRSPTKDADLPQVGSFHV